VKNQDFMGKTNYFFENSALQPLGSSSHMAACRSSLENSWKMSLILVFNKNSPWAHTELELDVLGVHRKLVKYVVHSSKRKNWKKNKKSSHKLPKQQSTNFWSQGLLGAKCKFYGAWFWKEQFLCLVKGNTWRTCGNNIVMFIGNFIGLLNGK
jgi:hypothetical protein